MKTEGMSLIKWVFILFLALKLTETGCVASWSWWWVTAPVWVGALLTAIVNAINKYDE